MNQHRMELKNAQEARERERELAKEIVEGDMDDDEAGGEFTVWRRQVCSSLVLLHHTHPSIRDTAAHDQRHLEVPI